MGGKYSASTIALMPDEERRRRHLKVRSRKVTPRPDSRSVTVELDVDTIAEIDAYAASFGMSRRAATIDLIEWGLDYVANGG